MPHKAPDLEVRLRRLERANRVLTVSCLVLGSLFAMAFVGPRERQR
jgi:hypothetical protein